jgi:competence protein ComFC
MMSFLLKKLVEWKDDLLHLVYPKNCIICQKELSKFEDEICSFCEIELKYTHYETYHDATSLDKLFWGRCQLKSTYSMLYFEKGGQTQKILHEIKYKGNQKLGEKMGSKMGLKLLTNTEKHSSIDALIPVPLHPRKTYVRGYNQSEIIANGVSEVMKIPINTNFLTRVQHAESQTKKSKFLRWDNIEEAFYVNIRGNEHLKHIAIIDDVITTGSTIESCIKKIHELSPDLEISVFSLAVTK